MAEYEIMIILDPKEKVETVNNISTTVFGKGIQEFKKIDNINLAYEIQGSMIGQYILIKVKTDAKNIQEWMRKINITKTIWRNLVINLDNEQGFGKRFIEKKFSKYPRLRQRAMEKKAAFEARKKW